MADFGTILRFTMGKISDIRVVLTSFVVSSFDVVLNLIVAMVTGSTVMLSQALQGFSDLITGGILYIGVRRSKRGSNAEFQFGYGREIFFWVLIAGIIMFAGTGVTSLVLGYRQFLNPDPIEHIHIAFLMLVFGLATNGYAFGLSLRRLKERVTSGDDRLIHQLLNSSIVETKATFIVDLLGTCAAVFGLISLGLYIVTDYIQFDGIGSMLIGVSMMIGAIILMRDVRDLIIGKAVDASTSSDIIRAAVQINGVHDVLDLRTMYLGSERLLVIIEVHLADEHTTDDVERITDEIKANVKRLVPLAHHIQVEVETPE